MLRNLPKKFMDESVLSFGFQIALHRKTFCIPWIVLSGGARDSHTIEWAWLKDRIDWYITWTNNYKQNVCMCARVCINAYWIHGQPFKDVKKNRCLSSVVSSCVLLLRSIHKIRIVLSLLFIFFIRFFFHLSCKWIFQLSFNLYVWLILFITFNSLVLFIQSELRKKEVQTKQTFSVEYLTSR